MSKKVEFESDAEAEETSNEKLYMFLHRARAHDRTPELTSMFSTEISIERLMNCSRTILEDRMREYEEIVSGNMVTKDTSEQYIHPLDIAKEKSMQRMLYRCFEKFPDSAIAVEEKCPVHSKKCRILQFNYGFLCFLHLLSEDSEPPQTKEIERSALNIEDDRQDEEVAIDANEEMAEASKETFEASVSLLVPYLDIEASAHMDDNEIEAGDLSLPCLPSWSFTGQQEFILLNDIMHLFNIREDYCLAALAAFSKADEGWVEGGVDKYLLVDSKVQDSEFIPGNQVLKDMFDEAKAGESQLPSEVESTAIVERLGLADMGRFEAHTEKQDDSKTTIHLWTRSVLEDDENQQVRIYFLTVVICI